MLDFGYDIADYRAVDPVFGPFDGLDRLLEKLHHRDIKLILDFVPNLGVAPARARNSAAVAIHCKYSPAGLVLRPKDTASTAGPNFSTARSSSSLETLKCRIHC
jgi:hypothetical protein